LRATTFFLEDLLCGFQADDLHVKFEQIACVLHRVDSVTDKRVTRAYGTRASGNERMTIRG